MLIRQIQIQNFRSIESITLNPSTREKSNLSILIGPNNAGKSNILEAIRILHNPLRTPNLEKSAFYREDDSNTIMLQMLFHTPYIYKPWITSDHTVEVWGIRLQRSIGKKARTKGQLIWTKTCLDFHGKMRQVPKQRPKKGVKLQFEPLLWIPPELADNLALIYLPADRRYSDHAPGRRRGTFNRVLQEVNRDFCDPTKSVSDVEPRIRSEVFRGLADQIEDLLKTRSFKNVETILGDVLESFFKDSLTLDFSSLASIDLYELLQPSIQESGYTATHDRVGDGLKSILVLAVHFAYHRALKQTCTFVIEEPEVFLHPHIQRQYFRFLATIPPTSQIFISTHSPYMFTLDNYPHLVRVSKSSSTHIAQCTIAPDSKDAKKLRRHYDASVNEAFFSSCAILVEGQSEKLGFPIYADKEGVDLDQENITIVFCGGKGDLKFLAQILQSFGIPVVVCFDLDIDDPKLNEALRGLFPPGEPYMAIGAKFNLEDEVKKVSGLNEDDWSVYLKSLGRSKQLRAIQFAELHDTPRHIRISLKVAKRYASRSHLKENG